MFRVEHFLGEADYQCSRALASIVEGGLLGTGAEIYREDTTQGTTLWHLDLIWKDRQDIEPGLLEEIQSRCMDTSLRYVGGDTDGG